MDREQKNKFDELYRLVDITAKARYRASTRLSTHGMWSQWTLSLLAIGLIIVSVVSLSGIQTNFTDRYSDVMQIVFSVIILTYSLLLGMGNFSARAERLLRCGMELSRIVRKVKPYKGKDDDEHDSVYNQLTKDYYDCLEKYENHKDVDFLSSRLEIERRKGFPEKGKEEEWPEFLIRYFYAFKSRLTLWLSVRVRLILAFSHYLITLVIVYGWLFLDVTKNLPNGSN